MSGNCAVSSFSFNYIVFIEEYGGHETEGTVALSYNIALNVSVIILASPNNSTVSLHYLSNHIVDKSVLVVNTLGIELGFPFLNIHLLEDIFEKAIVLLKDGVLGG